MNHSHCDAVLLWRQSVSAARRDRAAVLLVLGLGRDLIVDAAVGEVLLLRFSPGPELVLQPERLDGRQLRFRQCGFIARTEAVLGNDLLPFGRVQEIEVGLGYSAVPRFAVTGSTTATGGAASMLSDG